MNIVPRAVLISLSCLETTFYMVSMAALLTNYPSLLNAFLDVDIESLLVAIWHYWQLLLSPGNCIDIVAAMEKKC